MSLPEWFQLLLTCCCFVDDFRVHSGACVTVFDLISLTKSVDMDESQEKARSGKVAVVIVPPVSFQQLKFLEHKMCFYKVRACISTIMYRIMFPIFLTLRP